MTMHSALHVSGFAGRIPLVLVALIVPFARAFAQSGDACIPGEPTVLPITFASGDEEPTIPGSIAGHAYPMSVDTASSVTTLYRPALMKAGIQVRATATNYPGQDILIAEVPNMTVGPISRKGFFTVADIDEGIGGNLGADSFARYDTEIWWAGKQVRMTNPKGCRNVYLASWGKDAHIVPLDTDQSRRDMRAWFKVKINGHSVDTMFSTANSMSKMDLHTAARFGLTPQMSGAVEEAEVIGWRNERHRVWRVPVADMSIGPYRVQNATIRITDFGLSGEMMVLGADFLRNHRLLVSMSQRRLYISHLGGPSFSGPQTAEPEKKPGCEGKNCVAAP